MPSNRRAMTTGKGSMQTVWTAALSLLSAAALALVLPTTSALHERANSAVFVICAVGMYFLLRRAAEVAPTRRDKAYFLSFGFLMSFVYALGRYVYLYYGVSNIGAILLIACMLTPAVAALLAVAAHACMAEAARPVENATGAQAGFFERKRLFLLSFAALLICYLPCYLAFFPANINYDIGNQTMQAVTGRFSMNHPLLHTLYIKACLDAGVRFLGGYTGGFALYAATQTCLLTACFAYAFGCIVKLTPGKTVFHWMALLLFALYPSNHLFAITTTKDVLASGALLVSLSAFCLLLFCPEATQRRRGWTLALLAVSSALAMLLRNGMVYAYIAFALAILLGCGKRGWRLIASVLLAVALFYSTSAILKAALHAEDSSPVESLSVPLQQLVNASVQHPECFTAEEQALFDALIETNKRYLPHISDPIKYFVDPDVLMENRQAYWNLYRSIGKKAPGDYLDAFLMLNLGAWYPDEITHADVHTNHQGYLHTSDWFYTWDKSLVTVEKHSYLPAVEKLYKLFAQENAHQKAPVLSMLFSPGFLCQTMFALAFILLYRKQYAALLPFAPLIAYWLGLLLAPCIYIRYIYPIIVCLPLLTALALRAGPGKSFGEAAAPAARAA